jgi:RNA polymerase sigma-70 factor (ECF subfamily)
VVIPGEETDTAQVTAAGYLKPAVAERALIASFPHTMTSDHRRALNAAMVRFADGNRDAFREVFGALWPVVLAFCTGLLPSRADAEDAAQRALIKVFAQIADMDRNRDGVAWAKTIAAYEVMTARRTSTRRREKIGDMPVAIPDPEPVPDELLAQAQVRFAVRQTIRELPPRDQ